MKIKTAAITIFVAALLPTTQLPAQEFIYKYLSGEAFSELEYLALVEERSQQKAPAFIEELQGKSLVPVSNEYTFKNGSRSIYFHFEWVKLDEITEETYKGDIQEQHLDKLVGNPFPWHKMESNTYNPTGKPVMINFWYTGCYGCIKEMPELNALKETYGKDMDFISINWNKTEDVEKFLQKREFTWTHFSDEKQFLKDLFTGGDKLGAYPISILIDANGRVRFHLGALPEVTSTPGETVYEYSEIVKIIEDLIARASV